MYCITCGKELKSNEYLYCMDCLNNWLNTEMSELKTLKEGITFLITELTNMENWINRMIKTNKISKSSAYYGIARLITIQITNLTKFLIHFKQLLN